MSGRRDPEGTPTEAPATREPDLDHAGAGAPASAPPPSPSDAELASETREDDRADLHQLHEPIMREKTRPADGFQPVPLGLMFLFGALLLWGGWYLGEFDGNYREDVFTPRGEVALGEASTAPEKKDPMAIGRRVYASCTACHQADGNGVEGAFPPLNGSRWVTGSETTLARILLHGMKGPVEVKGVTYNGVMPAWSQLSDEEIAAVLTYIRGSWDNAADPVEPEVVAEIRAAYPEREEAWTAEALLAVSEERG